jgi:dipeptidyl aminopeptidase/acylaminoacyl peptidase
MSFLVNKAGQATFAFGSNTQLEYKAFRKVEGRWTALPDAITGSHFAPFLYSPDQKKIYAWSSHDGGPYQLVEANADASDPQTLMADPFSDFGYEQDSPFPYKIFAVASDTGIPRPDYINPTLPSAKLYMALSKAFHGQFVNFINFSKDGMELLFSTSSDRNPGTFYLIDRRDNKVRKLFDAQPSINPAQMSQRRPFRFKSSSGMELEGILTLPKGRRQTNLPMVLMPHGGPIGISDDWFYDDLAQMVASRGYLVLQVNFRGSGGRGPAFKQAGYKQWGTGMQQDLIDGVKWAIAHHFADAKRICAFGGSYGGYAALMQVIRAPGLYKCAISYDGVTDLNMEVSKSDTRLYQSGQNYFRMVLGDSKARAANSPVNLVDKIHVPVFLIHGKDDKRVPYDEAKEMRDALEKAGKPVQWLAKSGEGHGFYNVDNRIQMYTKVLAFLKRNIGPGAPVTGTQ